MTKILSTEDFTTENHRKRSEFHVFGLNNYVLGLPQTAVNDRKPANRNSTAMCFFTLKINHHNMIHCGYWLASLLFNPEVTRSIPIAGRLQYSSIPTTI